MKPCAVPGSIELRTRSPAMTWASRDGENDASVSAKIAVIANPGLSKEWSRIRDP